jgi:succinoglycan biosynthesis protein ExoA
MPIEPTHEPRTPAGAAQSRVLAVVPTLNERDHLEGVLRGLLAERAAFRAFHIAVVDGGSTDGTQDIARRWAAEHPEIQVLDNPKRLQSAAVNLAARRLGAQADVLIRCDAHASYPPRYCQLLIDSLLRHGADAVVVPMDSSGEGTIQRAVAMASNSPIGTGGSAHRAGRQSGFVDHGHHAAFRMAAFARAGGYDETFSHNEDAELDCRQRKLGARIYLDAGIRIGYRPRSTFGGLWSQYFKYGSGRARTVRRHPGSLRLRQLAVPMNLVLLILALGASPWFPAALAWPAFYLGVLAAVSVGLAVRSRSPAALLAGPAAVVMHTAWACGFLSTLVMTLGSPSWRPDAVAPLQRTLGRG